MFKHIVGRLSTLSYPYLLSLEMSFTVVPNHAYRLGRRVHVDRGAICNYNPASKGVHHEDCRRMVSNQAEGTCMMFTWL